MSTRTQPRGFNAQKGSGCRAVLVLVKAGDPALYLLNGESRPHTLLVMGFGLTALFLDEVEA